MPKTINGIEYPDEFLDHAKAVNSQRALRVVETIIEKGEVSSLEIQNKFGYTHAPRAARDLREHGIPLVTTMKTLDSGDRCGFYSFGDPKHFRGSRGGRRNIPKRIKTELVAQFGARCNSCRQKFDATLLQVDHRVPFEILHDEADVTHDSKDYMLVCPSCNRSKSWSCEYCPNWNVRDVDVCRKCYWASPENYEHLATVALRRLDITWTGEEISFYDALAESAAMNGRTPQDELKAKLEACLEGKTT